MIFKQIYFFPVAHCKPPNTKDSKDDLYEDHESEFQNDDNDDYATEYEDTEEKGQGEKSATSSTKVTIDTVSQEFVKSPNETVILPCDVSEKGIFQ